jgi:two-component system, OmpR family, response regulator
VRVLIAEDDVRVGAYIEKGLREHGHNTVVATDGKDALLLSASEPFDLIILDRMLPTVDGLTVLRTLRASDNHTPVLILSALAEVDERVKGLKAGADDYLTKPFSLVELTARVEALGRRPAAQQVITDRLAIADLELNLLARTVTRQGRRIELSNREFRLLEYMVRHAGQVLTRTMILEAVWDYAFDPQTNIVDQHISHLRQKIDRDFRPALIHTLRGAGYSVRAQ